MSKRRVVCLGIAAAAAFALVAFVMVGVMPRPLRPTDAMVAGAVATLAALAVLFGGFMASTKQRDVFFKRRPRN
jgi:hypothetical protein